MFKLIFFIYVLTGKVEKNESGLYNVHTNTSSVIESACKYEVIQWIKTKEFKYDDNLCEAGEIQ
jgi:hypothetical protein